ncbi:MAG: Smr/MutS family protein [Phycisphaerales bacterium]|nr:Smr/MutS family protein [Phycisphaerales bacterium]
MESQRPAEFAGACGEKSAASPNYLIGWSRIESARGTVIEAKFAGQSMASRNTQLIKTINLKQGMPHVEEARQRLNQAIDSARRSGFRALKLIHGYGSSGVGGGIRTAIRSSLTRRRREGKIRAFAGGEKWHVCEPEAQAILAECPALERESDLNMHNEGVTIVLL